MLFFIGLICMIISLVADIIVPLFTGKVIDAITKHESVIGFCVLMALVTIVSAIASYFRSLCFTIMSERISKNLSNDVFGSLVHKDVSFFDEKKIGEFLSRLSSDITIIKTGLGANVSLLIRTLVTLLIVLILLFAISWKLTLVMLGSLLPIIIFIQIYARYEKKLVKQS